MHHIGFRMILADSVSSAWIKLLDIFWCRWVGQTRDWKRKRKYKKWTELTYKSRLLFIFKFVFLIDYWSNALTKLGDGGAEQKWSRLGFSLTASSLPVSDDHLDFSTFLHSRYRELKLSLYLPEILPLNSCFQFEHMLVCQEPSLLKACLLRVKSKLDNQREKVSRPRAGGEGDNRGWDGWMASPTRWTWVWVNSRSWWWTGRPGVLQFMGIHAKSRTWLSDWTEQNSTNYEAEVYES